MPETQETQYPVIEVGGTPATLTPDGWQCEDEMLLAMLEIDRKLFMSEDYQPYPLNAMAEDEAGRWTSGKVIRLMPTGDGEDGRVY